MAGASSNCDAIHVTLNQKRDDLATDALATTAGDWAESIRHEAKITFAERMLEKLNKIQGFGFVVGGKVLDKASLDAQVTKLCSVGFVMSFVVALG